MAEVPVRAFPDVLRAVARSLRRAGDEDLSRELRDKISDATRPVLTEIRAELPGYMPNRYAGVLAGDLRLTTSKRLLSRTGAAVAIRAAPRGASQRKLSRLNRGILDHPLFGNRKRWFRQSAPGGGMHAGFFSDPIERAAPKVRDQIVTAINDVAEQAARRH